MDPRTRTRRIARTALASVATAVLAAATAVAGPPVPATPKAAAGVLHARPFRLERPYEDRWSAEKGDVVAGWLLVLAVDPDLVFPRQVAEPVLYVGSRTAERVNVGYPSGRVIALVPGDVDLARDPVWFGTPALPEQVTEEAARAERARADAAGVRPFPPDAAAAALERGGERRLDLSDRDALNRHLAGLLATYSPGETELATTLAAPAGGAARGR